MLIKVGICRQVYIYIDRNINKFTCLLESNRYKVVIEIIGSESKNERGKRHGKDMIILDGTDQAINACPKMNSDIISFTPIVLHPYTSPSQQSVLDQVEIPPSSAYTHSPITSARVLTALSVFAFLCISIALSSYSPILFATSPPVVALQVSGLKDRSRR